MYKLTRVPPLGKIDCVCRYEDMASIPFVEANTDYQQFKTDITSGVELQDADGNVMTSKQIKAFIKTLP